MLMKHCERRELLSVERQSHTAEEPRLLASRKSVAKTSSGSRICTCKSTSTKSFSQSDAGYPFLCVHNTIRIASSSEAIKMPATQKKTAAGAKKGQKTTKKYIINAKQPVDDRIFDAGAFTTFLQQRIKVDGRTGNLGDNITVTDLKDGRIEVVTHQEFSGRYLKYLTKKFLKKQQLRDWLRVVSTAKGEYSLKFFNVVGEEGEEEDD
ncbi:hypothetical protein MRB53_037868 [Persea americana]|nr:hypothetical protein MRB53_037868 [Persea americana]